MTGIQIALIAVANFIFGVFFGTLLGWQLCLAKVKQVAKRERTENMEQRQRRKMLDTQENIAARIANSIYPQFVVQMREPDESIPNHRLTISQGGWPVLRIDVDMSSIDGGDIRWYVCGSASKSGVRFVGAEDSAKDVISFTSEYLGRHLDSTFKG